MTDSKTPDQPSDGLACDTSCESELDVAELAASLCDAAERLGDAAAVATMLADALWVLLPHVSVTASPAARLAAEACIRVGQRAAVDFNAAHLKFIAETERYEGGTA